MKVRILQKNLFSLLAAIIFLFSGCELDDDGYYDELWTAENSLHTLDGTWVAQYGDSYIINLSDATLEYDGGYGSGYAGTIEEIRKFNSGGTVGIIFIRYTSKPVDYFTEEEPDGDYIGIYFRNLTAAQGDFTTPYTAEEPIPARESLQSAKNTFTEGSVGKYTSLWSACIRE